MSNKISLYIHIPFCKKKCLYCDFPSYGNMENSMNEYVKVLSEEIKSLEYNKFNTIFIGGGTPTFLLLKEWEVLKESLNYKLIKEPAEFTVEINPGTADKEKLLFLKNMGVNRLSIGLQAWQENLLKNLGRIHSKNEFLELYKNAREIGFDNINIDLMYGLPSQSFENWKETLKEVVLLEPEHISCYSLIIEENTPFYNMYNKGVIKIPSEEEERKMNEFTITYLKEKGYDRYEISNWAKKDKECKHNLVYWELENYIGCGSSAHSYINGSRFSNSDDIKEYMKNFFQLNKNEKYKNSIEADMEEFMFLGLRKIKGISIKKFNEKFKKSIFDIYGNVINKYVENGYLILNEDRIFLSEKGIEISNSIMCEFIIN
ncbi:radical SAM family heme chaperone HemW [Clostridium grantii]|uniref:Heme chaperone HemW n=1 Tax=Clostridium grantii DSM 8605 TaxID=1121316 RepID=A0A1M5XKR4_9CLOT|nr:radical SAM family heme chaperone HemW [Clostridium grantii]SHI00329.1 coproporphyrinogen III oxidase, anaerobic [Clostridium grantii DSM 8605]